MKSIIDDIRKNLRNQADIKTQESGQRFFKEKIKSYGVKATLVKQISKEHFKVIKAKPKSEIFDLCDELWRSGYIEESLIASHWSYFVRKDYEPKDFKVFAKWIKNYVNNWASCDTLCTNPIGIFLETYPKYVPELKKWAKSKNRWMRRAAAVSLIVPARKGKFLSDIFEIADILLLDKDDLVQKGYGWMLKSASKLHQQEVFDYIMSKKAIMPRTSLRYAIEKMPKELKSQAMTK